MKTEAKRSRPKEKQSPTPPPSPPWPAGGRRIEPPLHTASPHPLPPWPAGWDGLHQGRGSACRLFQGDVAPPTARSSSHRSKSGRSKETPTLSPGVATDAALLPLATTARRNRGRSRGRTPGTRRGEGRASPPQPGQEEGDLPAALGHQNTGTLPHTKLLP